MPNVREYDESADEEYESPQPRRRGQQTQQQSQQGQQGGGPLGGLPLGGGGVGDALPVGNVGETANNLVNSAQDTLGNVTGGAVSNTLGGALGGGGGGGDGGKSDTLKLRLDLNLEVEVTLKARIHGDLTLALLSVFSSSSLFLPSFILHLLCHCFIAS